MRQTITTERVGTVVALLHSGGSWPTRTLAERVDMTTSGAYAMLSKLSRVLPLTLDDDGWTLVR
jgi:predicted transcriptional regulator